MHAIVHSLKPKTLNASQMAFEDCQASYDPANIAALLQNYPYHIDSLMAMFDLYRVRQYPRPESKCSETLCGFNSLACMLQLIITLLMTMAKGSSTFRLPAYMCCLRKGAISTIVNPQVSV